MQEAEHGTEEHGTTGEQKKEAGFWNVVKQVVQEEGEDKFENTFAAKGRDSLRKGHWVSRADLAGILRNRSKNKVHVTHIEPDQQRNWLGERVNVGLGCDLERLSSGEHVVICMKPGFACHVANVKEGSVIVSIGGVNVKGKPISKLRAMTIGPVGTSVVCKIKAPGFEEGDEPIEMTLRRTAPPSWLERRGSFDGNYHDWHRETMEEPFSLGGWLGSLSGWLAGRSSEDDKRNSKDGSRGSKDSGTPKALREDGRPKLVQSVSVQTCHDAGTQTEDTRREAIQTAQTQTEDELTRCSQ